MRAVGAAAAGVANVVDPGGETALAGDGTITLPPKPKAVSIVCKRCASHEISPLLGWILLQKRIV